MADQVGQQFGNYRLLRLLGHGGFADVYLGEHIYMGTQAAIKLLHTQLGDKDRERFQQEARTVAHLEHPHIVRVLEFGVEEKTPFLVLSYAPHGTLRTRYPRGSVLPLPKILEYVKQVADALQYAHSERVIHRDIKPENMLLGRNDEILLTDFGIALVMANSHSMSTKDLAGTAAYMAPEQIEARPRAASDQYSLGIVVYEWLSGVCPFQGTFTEIAFKHTVAPVPSLRERVPELPTAVEEVIVTALAKDPTRRFASVQSFARALEQAGRSVQIASVLSTPVDTEGPTIRVSKPFEIPSPSIQPQVQPVVPVGDFGEKATPAPPAMPPSPLTPQVFTPHNQPGPTPITPYSSPEPVSPLPPTSLTPAFSPAGVGRAKQLAGVQRRGPVTPLPSTGLPGSVPGDDRPPVLRKLPQMLQSTKQFGRQLTASPRRMVLLIVLALLVVGGGVFGTMYALSRPRISQTRPLTYNQAVAANGEMFGFNPQHTHFNQYETTLGTQNVATLHQTWAAPLDSPIYFSSPVVVNGVAYIGTSNNKLYAFDTVSRQQKWVVVIGTTFAINSSPAVVHGIVYASSTNHNLYAFDASTGKQKWMAQTAGEISSSPTVASGIVYIGSSDSHLYAFDAITGKLKWRTSTVAAIAYSSPAVASGIVYIGSSDHRLYAFDALTGQQKWAVQTGDVILSSPTVVNNVVYVGSYDHHLYAFDALAGRLKWKVSIGDKILSSPAVANGIVYIGSFNGQLYAFDAATGRQRWVASARDIIEASPMVANGLVYIGSWDHEIYALDALTGHQKWATQTGGRIYASPMVANGVVYIGSSDGKLYAFSLAR